jgi:hypothetical protein
VFVTINCGDIIASFPHIHHFIMVEFISDSKTVLDNMGWFANLVTIVSVLLSIKIVVEMAKKLMARCGEKSRERIVKKMNDPDYIEWSREVLRTIYAGSEFVSIYQKNYPAVIFRPGKDFSYPFSDLCYLESTEIDDLRLNSVQSEYLRFLRDTVKRPKMRGFSAKEIVLDAAGLVIAIDARATTYQHNIVTAHILEWELFKRYKKNKEISEDILSELALRSVYHGGNSPNEAILKPSNAYPLISVQALVIYKDYKSPIDVKWKAIVAQRGKNVAIKPELWQIHPAGGFEVYGDQDDDLDLHLTQGFDVSMALLREYAEEIYRAEELDFRSDGRDSGSVLSEPHVEHLVRLIHANKASIDFLGVITDLTVLRHELSFLIVIDDPEYSKYPILGSSEATNIFSMTMAELKNTFSNQKIHSSSAGLLQLAIESDRLALLGISEELAFDLARAPAEAG